MVESIADVRKKGSAKIVAGATVALVGAFLYPYALTAATISGALGASATIVGMAAQGFSKGGKKQRLYEFGQALRLTGSMALMFAGACASSPVSGAIYAIEGAHNVVFPAKNRDICGKIVSFTFGLLAGPEFRNSYKGNQMIDSPHSSKSAEEQPLVTRTITREVITEAQNAAKSAADMGMAQDTNNTSKGIFSGMKKRMTSAYSSLK